MKGSVTVSRHGILAYIHIGIAYPDVLQHHPRHELFRLQDPAAVEVVHGDQSLAPGLVHVAAQSLFPRTQQRKFAFNVVPHLSQWASVPRPYLRLRATARMSFPYVCSILKGTYFSPP